MFPFSFECLRKHRHEEEKQDWGDIIALTNADRLWEFNDLFFDFQYYDKVAVRAFDCSNKSGRSAISFKDIKKEGMIRRIVCFDEVNECNVGRYIMILPHGG